MAADVQQEKKPKPKRRSEADEVDSAFEDEGIRLIAELKLGSGNRYSALDAIWQNLQTQAKVYVGNIHAAKSKEILKAFNITHIVNCQDLKAENFHEDDPHFSYYRFPISYWPRAKNVYTNEGVVAYFQEVFEWIDRATAAGNSVLVHCLAGAHRAGTSGVAYVMHAGRLDLVTSRAMAIRCRPAINPILGLDDLLQRYDRARKALGMVGPIAN